MFFFTIVRHGQTKGNETGIVQGRTDGELTDLGIRMAKLLGERLEDETFTHIYSSDLKRCRDTTSHIVSTLRTPIPPIEYTAKLRERDSGDWEFQSHQLVYDKMRAMNLPLYLQHKVEVPNGETYEQCKERAGNIFREIVQAVQNDETRGKDKNVLVVSHGTFIACLTDYLRENEGLYKLVNFNEDDLLKRRVNTCMTRFSISQDHPAELEFSHFWDGDHFKHFEGFTVWPNYTRDEGL